MVIDEIGCSDFHDVCNVKQQERFDGIKKLPETSTQFEAILLQSALKNTRIEQYFNSLQRKDHETSQSIPNGQQTDNIAVGLRASVATLLEKQREHMVCNASNITASATHLVDKKEFKISQSVDDFVKSIWPYVRQASNLIGLDPKVLMAQAALETGWGQFIAKDSNGYSSNNLFNIKASAAHDGQSVQIKTTEFINDAPVKTVASFKQYLSVEHSLNDYISLIKTNHRYQTALANADDPKRYIDELQSAGYATDPNYANKLYSIYHGDELQHALERNGYAQ